MFVDLAHSWTQLAVELEDAQAYMAAIGNGVDPVEREKLRPELQPWPAGSRVQLAAYLMDKVEWHIADRCTVGFGTVVETANIGRRVRVPILSAMPSLRTDGYAKTASPKFGRLIALLT